MNRALVSFRAAATIQDCRHLLSAPEQDRLSQLSRGEDQVAYVAAHGLARLLAASLIDVDPSALAWQQACPGCGGGDHGRPSFPEHPDVAVSISHAVRDDQVWVAAVVVLSDPGGSRPSGGGTGVGIDVEFRSARVPQRALSPSERAAVARGTDPVDLWVRKECLIKAGRGTLARADAVEVVGRGDAPATRAHGLSLGEWTSPDGSVRGAWAVSPGTEVRTWVRGAPAS